MDEHEINWLEDFVVLWSDDPAQHDPNLIHDQCGQRICTVEGHDTLRVLASTALGHLETCEAA